jgi:Cof subfamily protein (haloacid dehalogenase superfamily)
VKQLFATDLDGTLLNSSGGISSANIMALNSAQSAGLHVVFVTGRPPRWMTEIGNITGMHGHAICANGALVLDVATGAILQADYIERDLGLEAVSRLRQIDPGISFAVEIADDNVSFVIENNYRPRWETQQEVPKVPVEEMFSSGRVIKLMARPSEHAKLDADQFVRAAEEVASDIVDLTHSNIFDVLLEMSPSGVNKGTALAKFASNLGVVQSSVAAVGDMPNDVPMISWAGKGAAVANAHESVKAVADVFLPSNDEDAVAVFIQELLGS